MHAKSWLCEKKERKKDWLLQGPHTVPINSCENGDGSCWPHEVILQAWMENIDLLPPFQASTEKNIDWLKEKHGVGEHHLSVQQHADCVIKLALNLDKSS